ncbi:tetratricopeptide repeat protein [Magnetospirillum sp. SS-4]|uniref:tetratricopeptide repeat protein n=1 Tax=Magnetospirillum sp. SS-4 TaxID=2681465 RepID=UPI0013861003|nr:tetratricopeptide repeat protein [Magnetospirillum sp. SS-4]CAA7612977.1 TPR repeat-containing protein [Magnetospirillum sp. SS-4]
MVISVGRLSCIALVAAALLGCAPRSAPQAEATGGIGLGGEGGLGAYLAGRYAQSHGDTRSAAEFLLNAARRDPDNTDLQQRAFSLLLAEGRLDEAMPIAERLLIIDGDSALPLLAAGLRDARDGRLAAAEKRFAALPQKGINGFLGPLLLAWTRQAQNDPDGALKLLKPRSETASFAPIYEFHAGLIAEMAGRLQPAEGHYAAALAGQTSVRTVEAVGGFFQRTGRMEAAAQLYQRYHVEHNDRSLLDGRRQMAAGAAVARVVSDPIQGLAEVMFDTASLVRQGNAHDLALVFSRLALGLRPDFPLAQLLVADTLGRQRRLAEANAIYRAIDGNSQAAEFARLRLAFNLDEAGDTDGALSELRRLANARPDAFEPVLSRGDILRRHKRYAEAAEAYDQAIERAARSGEPPNWTLHYARGMALERSRQWARAEADFKEALRLKPDQPDVLNYLGYSWVDQGVNLDEGRKLIERAVQQRPNDGAIVDSLGWAFYRTGDFQAAVKHLERAVELKPEDPTINEHLGDALWRVGRVDEARFQWNRAMSLDPEPEQIEALREKISTGRLPAAPAR